MAKKLFVILSVMLLSFCISSCRRASELPPLNGGYAKEVLIPEPEDLTAADRAYLKELEDEYENAIK